MLPVALYIILAIGCTPPETIKIRKFALVTTNGENVFNQKFGQNTLRDTSDRVDLIFRALGKQFAFELQRTSAFSPKAVVRIIGRVHGTVNVLVNVFANDCQFFPSSFLFYHELFSFFIVFVPGLSPLKIKITLCFPSCFSLFRTQVHFSVLPGQRVCGGTATRCLNIFQS